MPHLTLSQGLWGLNQGLELHLPGSLGGASPGPVWAGFFPNTFMDHRLQLVH